MTLRADQMALTTLTRRVRELLDYSDAVFMIREGCSDPVRIINIRIRGGKGQALALSTGDWLAIDNMVSFEDRR